MDKQAYIKFLNKIRKENKNKWVSFTHNIEGLTVSIKFFNTFIQVIEVNHGTHITKDSGPMDCNVSEFNRVLKSNIGA